MKWAGFTLTELFVVIATIALLMAISVPSLQNSRQHAKAVLCGSNIKQLVLGLIMYGTENKTFPYGFHNSLTSPPGGFPGGAAYDRKGWWWFNYCMDYSKRDETRKTILRCPSKQLIKPELKYNILCGNYGVNQSTCKSSRGRLSHAEFIGKPLCSADILYPSQTLLVVDSGYSMITWWHATNAPPVALDRNVIEDTAYIPGLIINSEKDLWPGQEWDAIDGRHPNKTINVGFADGHMSRKKADDLFVEKAADDYKNKNPLWVPK